MIRLATATVSIVTLLSAAAFASEAETSASAASSRYQRHGTAAASARYDGRLGFSRTNARSGPVSSARGIAVGVDASGISLSVSSAISPRRGPAIATSFNLSIDRNGGVSRSRALSVSRGPIRRSATAGGRVGTGRHGRHASAFAAGKSDRLGGVETVTRSRHVRPARYSEVRRYRRPCR